MKNLALILALLLPFASMAADQADTQSCQAYGYASPSFSTVFCNMGNCSANIHWSPITVAGTCNGGKRFNAYGNVFSTTAYGQCRNGFIQMMIPSQMVQFNGTCEEGRLSANSTYTQSQFVSGSCYPNGTSMIQVSASNIRFDGQCVGNAQP
jgi:hypothetical protein